MQPIPTRVRPESPEFRDNVSRMTALVEELRGRMAQARLGGGEKYLERHRAQGKLPVRERIDRLVDPGAPFLELSPLAATGLYDGDAPSADIRAWL